MIKKRTLSVANSWAFLNRSQVVPFHKNNRIIGHSFTSMKQNSRQSFGTLRNQKISWLTEPYCFAIPRNVFVYLWVSQGDLKQIVGYLEHWKENYFYCLMKNAILQGYSVACPISALHAHLNHNRFWQILYQQMWKKLIKKNQKLFNGSCITELFKAIWFSSTK